MCIYTIIKIIQNDLHISKAKLEKIGYKYIRVDIRKKENIPTSKPFRALASRRNLEVDVRLAFAAAAIITVLADLIICPQKMFTHTV